MKILVTLEGGNGQEREREESEVDVTHDMDVDIAAQDIISGWVLEAGDVIKIVEVKP